VSEGEPSEVREGEGERPIQRTVLDCGEGRGEMREGSVVGWCVSL
jgi:hypothetical protein